MKTVPTMSREEWAALRYPISLRRLSEEEGGGWLATIPLLGEAGFAADGESPDEAIGELEELRCLLYDRVMASGQPIPIPEDSTEAASLPSGKWTMRTSTSLHALLRDGAIRDRLSFNAYCVQCLERGNAFISMTSEMSRVSDRLVAQVQINSPDYTAFHPNPAQGNFSGFKVIHLHGSHPWQETVRSEPQLSPNFNPSSNRGFNPRRLQVYEAPMNLVPITEALIKNFGLQANESVDMEPAERRVPAGLLEAITYSESSKQVS